MISAASKPFTKSVRAWLPVWAIIYLLIISLGILTPDRNDFLTIVKLGGIILCFIYVLRTFPDDRLLLITMFTTCIADLVLATDNTSALGVIIFFVAQILHRFRLSERNTPPKSFLIYIAIATTTIILNLIFNFLPLIFVASFFYVITLIGNIFASLHWHKIDLHSTYAWCALVGFALFLCCDICTGISFMSLNQVFPAFLYDPANFFAWFFYYPSQILVSNSSKCATIEAKEG